MTKKESPATPPSPSVTNPPIPPVTSKNDDEYKEATQAVIDDNMRTDILGPRFCKVIREHTPSSDEITALIIKKVKEDPNLKTAIKGLVDERNSETKMRWFQRGIGVVGTIVLALVIWGIQKLIEFASKPPLLPTALLKPSPR